MADTASMEDIHGVDVSWLHHSKRDRNLHLQPTKSPGTSSLNGVPPPPQHEMEPKPPPSADPPAAASPAPALVLPESPATPLATSKALPKRPGLLNRGSSEKVLQINDGAKNTPRRNSWMSNITSKFSSGSPQAPHNGATPKTQSNSLQPVSQGKAADHTSSEVPQKNVGRRGSNEQIEPSTPQPKSNSSFFSNALRRLSTNSSNTTTSKVMGTGYLCPRKVMNIDPNRQRVLIPELDQNKLRRVAFCVDVEIAGGPQYKDDASEAERKRKFKEKKLKEKGEGAALKNPQAVAEEKERDGVVQAGREEVGTEEAPNPEGTILDGGKEKSDKKKEKKKKSEEERKARKEEKRRKAEDSGSIPMQISRGDDTSTIGTSPPGTPAPNTPKQSDRPTTDPVRIYRRCCQLRETPVLKRITEQLSRPDICPIATPGVVSILDLTGSRLTLADVVTLSDWLAVVPVKKLLMEDANLTDEGVRVVLAGLLAAMSPDEPRRRVHSNNNNAERYEERSGFIEKLSLKNNPKITKEGWKHISLFIYMCKSIKALDLSMIFFPESPPSPTLGNEHDEHADGEVPAKQNPPGLAEIFSKSIAERLGGSRLEELILAECALSSHAIRKIIDSITISGVSRLVIANNSLDDEGLDCVLRYIKSGVCQGIDLGGNDLRNKLDRLAEVLTKKTPLWALSLADCNLEPASLKPLWPALTQLPNLRFLDFSHNQELFTQDPSALTGMRKYLPYLRILKRFHLIDVNMSPAQAIALAEVLPECPQLCHLNILQNPQLSALSSATGEEQQEEACALYASLMAAARVSHTLICIDIDVPSADNSEVVKAIAKQVIAYCLRNLEYFTASEIPDATNAPLAISADRLKTKEVNVPEVLLHLVGYSEGQIDPNADDAPDDDYIVSGNGVIKALNYCLSEKASDLRRRSLPASGTATPRSPIERPEIGAVRAMNMSKSLLESARKIKDRLQPAIIREAKGGDEMAFRRLLFLDNTLKSIIQRFEDEYPETRIPPASDVSETSVPNTLLSSSNSQNLPSDTHSATTSFDSTILANDSDDDDEIHPALRSRHNSDVSLAARALSIEEGQAHKLGHQLKRTVFNSQSEPYLHGTSGSTEEVDAEPEHLKMLRAKLESLSGDEWKACVEQEGWDGTIKMVHEKAEYLRKLQEEDPAEFAKVRDLIMQKVREKEGDLGGNGDAAATTTSIAVAETTEAAVED